MVPRLFAFSLILFVAGCSLFVSAPDRMLTGENVICILYNETAFKNQIVAHISDTLTLHGYTIVTDQVKRSKYYPAAEYGAVVYMAEYWAWHVPMHQKRYFRANNEAANIVFVTTSGDPDVRITEPFDAVTSASDNDNVGDVSREVLSRLARILP